MGASLSTCARSRKRLSTLPSNISVNTGAKVSRRADEYNPVSTTGREIDRLLESHTRIVRSALKPKLFHGDGTRFEKSSKNYSVALRRLDATLSNLFEALLKVSSRMELTYWEST